MEQKAMQKIANQSRRSLPATTAELASNKVGNLQCSASLPLLSVLDGNQSGDVDQTEQSRFEVSAKGNPTGLR